MSDAWAVGRANAALLKDMVPAKVNPILLYPFGTCDTVTDGVPWKTALGSPLEASPNLAGLWWLQNGDLERAAQVLERAWEREKTPSITGYALGVARLLGGDRYGAFHVWRTAGAYSRLIELGKRCREIGNNETALLYYTAALNSVADSDESAYRELVLFFATTQDDARFQQALSGYLALARQGTLDYNRTLGSVYLARNQPARALELFELAVGQSPRDPWIWYNLGVAAYNLGNYAQARTSFQQAIRLAPEAEGPYVYMGHSYAAEQNLAQAIVWYERALAVAPGDSWPMMSLARVYMTQGHYELALRLALQAMRVDKRAYVPAFAAEAAAKLGEWPLARQLITQAVEMEPENATYQLQLAEVCQALADSNCARAAYQRVLALDPTNALARRGLEQLSRKEP